MSFFPTRSIALEIGTFQIHWYGIMYLLAAVIAIYLLPRIQKERGLQFSSDQWISIVSWGVLGVILGGRLGYVFFYEPNYYLYHPLQILAVWNGGMSSHGGFIGVAVTLLTYAYFRHLPMARIADVIVIPVALGLALGRLGNFINLELYGTVTDLPWAISIPGIPGLRHPTQIYALIKDLLIAGACYMHLRTARPMQPGRTFALFFILYGIGRFLVEYFRDQSYANFELGFLTLTRGQLLTFPIFLLGLLFWIWFGRSVSSKDDA